MPRPCVWVRRGRACPVGHGRGKPRAYTGTVKRVALLGATGSIGLQALQVIEEHPELELLAPVPLNIVCFRYAAPGMSEEALDRLNRSIVEDLHRSAIAVPSHTRIRGRFAIRTAISNHRTRFQDLDLLVEKVLDLGRSKVGRKSALTSS